MKQNQIVTAVILATSIFLSPAARADLCSSDPTDPYFIKETDLGQNFVLLKRCLVSDPNKCAPLGDRYFGIEELSSKASGLKTGSEIQAAAWAAWAAGTSYTTVRQGSKEMQGYSRLGKVAGGATMATLLGGMFAFPTVIVAGVANGGTGSINPLVTHHAGSLFDTLAKGPTKGCIYVSGKTRIYETSIVLDRILRDMDRDARVVESDSAKRLNSVGSNKDPDPFEPFDPLKASAAK